MKTFFACVALALACVAVSAVDLTPENANLIGGDKPIIVEFYAPWCGHCKALAPEWELVEKAFEKETGAIIAKCDADAHRSVSAPHGVSGFPTIMYFAKGSSTGQKYEGGRTAADIVQFVNTKAKTRAFIAQEASDVVILTAGNFASIVGQDASVLVEFYAPWCGHCKSLAPVYEKVASSYVGEKDLVIAKCDATEHPSLASKFEVSGYPTLKWFSKGSAEAEAYSAGRSEEAFVTFINEKTNKKRTVGGGFASDAGRDAELDSLAQKFMAADAGARADILTETTEKASKIPTGKFYSKAMKRILDKGESYLTTEKARLSRMIESGSASVDKINSFHQRINILNVFAESVEEDKDGKEEL